MPAAENTHPFLVRPNRTFLTLTVPVLFSTIAEPITALVDLAFVTELGAAPVAGMGAAISFLSSVIWIFGFLQVGTQTEVARASGGDDQAAIQRTIGIALNLATAFGVLLAAGCLPFVGAIATMMEATGAVHTSCADYLTVRLLGVPAVLISFAGFGAMRGRLDMRTPLVLAILINLINLVLDPLLIFGLGPIPAWGVTGAAAASTVAQWVGAGLIILRLRRGPGFRLALDWPVIRRFAVVGRDMIIRTTCLTSFLLLATREATRIGENAGAAHLAIRHVWTLTALALDALAMTAQSLVGYFAGAGKPAIARRVARVGTIWSVATGVVLAVAMLVAEPLVAAYFVPPAAVGVFGLAWRIGAIFQPVNALTFVTDGIHWGTSDYRYLRNVMLAATVIGGASLWFIDFTGPAPEGALAALWWITGAWIAVRATGGMIRIWPGIGAAPLGRSRRP